MCRFGFKRDCVPPKKLCILLVTRFRDSTFFYSITLSYVSYRNVFYANSRKKCASHSCGWRRFLMPYGLQAFDISHYQSA